MQLKKIFDYVLFFCVIVIGELIALHGNDIVSLIFYKALVQSNDINLPITVYTALFLSATTFLLIRMTQWQPKYKMLLSALVGLLSTIAMQYGVLSNVNSSLIFFLQLLLYATACGVIWIETYLGFDLEKDFWKFMFENVFIAIRYILIVYGAIAFILRYRSSANCETMTDFVTSLSYPTFIIVIVVFMISYWVLIPSWEKYADSAKTIKSYGSYVEAILQELFHLRK